MLPMVAAVLAHSHDYGAEAYPGYSQLSSQGQWGPCRLTSPTDNDRTAYGMKEVSGTWVGGQLLTTNSTSCGMCETLCTAGMNISGYAPYDCVAFECTDTGWRGGPRCELWAEVPQFVAKGSCAGFQDTQCMVAASPFHCFVKDAPPPPPPTEYSGYMELTNDGYNGPCRGLTPTDNDRTWYGMKDEGGTWVGGQLLTTPYTSCDVCADLCSQGVNISGYPPYDCVAFECTNTGWRGGPRCELWAKVPQFAAAGSCASYTDTSCTLAASDYHCFTKSLPPPPPPMVFSNYMELTNNGYNGPCRGLTPTDNDRTWYGMTYEFVNSSIPGVPGMFTWVGGQLLTTPYTDCTICENLCSQGVKIDGYPPYDCVAFECTTTGWRGGGRCELWAKMPQFAAAGSCSGFTDTSCTLAASDYHCFTKVQPPPPPPASYSGYWELTNDGYNGPCRGLTPTDNDRTWYGMTYENNTWVGGQLLTTPYTSCDVCADLCSQGVNISGYPPYDCVAFECTNTGWRGGPRCELWAKVPQFAGQGSCASYTDTACTVAASPYHCFVKGPSNMGGAALPSAGAAALEENANPTELAYLETIVTICIFLLLFSAGTIAAVAMILQKMTYRGFPSSEPKTSMMQMHSVGRSDDPKQAE